MSVERKRCPKGTLKNKKTGECEKKSEISSRKTRKVPSLKNKTPSPKKVLSMNSKSMNTEQKVKVVEDIIDEIIYSGYGNMLQREYDRMSKDAIKHLIKYYTNISVNHIKKDVTEKVLKNAISYKYDDIYDVVLQCIEFDNLYSGIRETLDKVVEILHENRKKKATKSDVDHAISKVNKEYNEKMYELERECQRECQKNLSMLKINEWIYK